jgi:hypothetical protein
MKKHSILLYTLTIAIVAAFYLWSARKAETNSESSLSKFKELERNLEKSIDAKQSDTGIGDVKKFYPTSVLKSQIIFLIDSLKHAFEKIQSPSTIEQSKQSQLDLKRLLRYIQQFNRSKWDMVDSQLPDTIKYWQDADNFSDRKWLHTYFNDQSKETAITYLNHLRNQVLNAN